MAKQKGRLLLIKYYNGTTFVMVGGTREKTITINNEQVDVTDADSAGIRELLEGGGVNSVSIKMQGLYIEDAAAAAIRVDANTNAHRDYQIVIPGSTDITYEGTFMVASFEEAGTYNGPVTNSLTLESASAVTIS